MHINAVTSAYKKASGKIKKIINEKGMAGVEITSGSQKFPPYQAKCSVSKTNKTSKTSGCCFKNAKIAVLEHLELNIFFAAQPWWVAFT